MARNQQSILKTEYHLKDCKFESDGRRKWTDKRTTKNLQKEENRTKRVTTDIRET